MAPMVADPMRVRAFVHADPVHDRLKSHQDGEPEAAIVAEPKARGRV